ncbi:MAG: hypothetical protein CMP49_04155 [Flavobacteriales bacterium]|nr:hypothetical protein [Flavobacteriales bacterium]|tara:strand:- start:3757 stop:5547 length:1791 start_codon:yes stop_codon:yes gene_type:complete
MKKLLLLFFLPLIIISQEEVSEENKEKRDFVFTLLEVENVRPFLETKGWNTLSAASVFDEYGNNVFKYTFSKYQDRVTIWDYEEIGFENKINIETDKYFYNFFFQLIQNSGYTVQSKTINEAQVEEILFEKNPLSILFKSNLNSSRDHSIEITNIKDETKRKQIFEAAAMKRQQKIAAIQLQLENILLTTSELISIEDYNGALDEITLIQVVIDSIEIDYLGEIDIEYYQTMMVSKSNEIEELKRISTIAFYLDQGSNYYNAEKFQLSLDSYQKVLVIDSTNEIALIKIIELEEILNIVNNREKVYSYKNLDKNSYQTVISRLESKLNTVIDESNNGYVNFFLSISFDTLGNNLTTFNINENSKISEIHKNSIFQVLDEIKNSLQATKIKSHYVKSEETINTTIDWNTNKYHVKYSEFNITPPQTRIIENKIRNKGLYGKYEISKKKKQLNGVNTYNDLTISNFQVEGSPSDALYSLIIPGLGSQKTTYGKYGKKTLQRLIPLIAITVGAKTISNKQYEKYSSSTNSADLSLYGESADLWHRIYLGGLSLSTTVYLNDIRRALINGFKNKKVANDLIYEIKQSPISIEKRDIVLEN